MTTTTAFEIDLKRYFRGVMFSEYEVLAKLELNPGTAQHRLSELQKAGKVRLVQARAPRRFNIWRLKE